MIIICNNIFMQRTRAPLVFLLAQVGAHAAMRFGERLSTLHLTPPDAGILRMLGASGGLSQQELSTRLGVHPSRLVAILDALEERRLVERRPNAEDRRQYALHLTEKGHGVLSEISRIGRDHLESLCASLTAAEREQLGELLQKIATEQGLSPGVHPGYRRMRPGTKQAKAE
jgi:DNA-binding MarR family transcriptional regulator